MVNVGIVGCGYWGAKHVRVFNTLPEAKLTIVCDKDKDKLKAVASAAYDQLEKRIPSPSQGAADQIMSRRGS